MSEKVRRKGIKIEYDELPSSTDDRTDLVGLMVKWQQPHGDRFRRQLSDAAAKDAQSYTDRISAFLAEIAPVMHLLPASFSACNRRIFLSQHLEWTLHIPSELSATTVTIEVAQRPADPDQVVRIVAALTTNELWTRLDQVHWRTESGTEVLFSPEYILAVLDGDLVYHINDVIWQLGNRRIQPSDIVPALARLFDWARRAERQRATISVHLLHRLQTSLLRSLEDYGPDAELAVPFLIDVLREHRTEGPDPSSRMSRHSSKPVPADVIATLGAIGHAAHAACDELNQWLPWLPEYVLNALSRIDLLSASTLLPQIHSQIPSMAALPWRVLFCRYDYLLRAIRTIGPTTSDVIPSLITAIGSLPSDSGLIRATEDTIRQLDIFGDPHLRLFRQDVFLAMHRPSEDVLAVANRLGNSRYFLQSICVRAVRRVRNSGYRADPEDQQIGLAISLLIEELYKTSTLGSLPSDYWHFHSFVIQRIVWRMKSYYRNITMISGSRDLERIPSPTPDALQVLMHSEQVATILGMLDAVERDIIVRRHAYREDIVAIAASHALSREEVYIVLERAMRRLRRRLT